MNTKRTILGAISALVSAALLATAIAMPNAEAASVPTLQGESLQGHQGPNFALDGFGNPLGSCDTQTTSTINYQESGIATGPYPGTFTETGSFTIGPQPVPGQSAPLTAFHATFHIDSPVGQIDGTKDVILGPNSIGICARLANQPVDPFFCQGASPCEADITNAGMSAEATYDATITAITGTFRDTGTARVNGFTRSTRTLRASSISDSFGEQFLRSNGVVPLDAAAVTLSPATAINTVGGSHTVTATATNVLLQPVANATVLFTVQGSVTTSGSCTTGSNGQCSFTYQGPQLPGADLIRGCADNNRNGLADPTEPCGEATKIWMLPATTPGQVTGGGWIEKLGGGRVSFGFNARSDGTTVKGNCNLIDHAMSAHIKCLTVDSLVVAATHATFFGQASIDGTTTTYRIDVDDLGEPGTQDTFKIQTDSGYLAGGVLAGGNIQIHN